MIILGGRPRSGGSRDFLWRGPPARRGRGSRSSPSPFDVHCFSCVVWLNCYCYVLAYLFIVIYVYVCRFFPLQSRETAGGRWDITCLSFVCWFAVAPVLLLLTTPISTLKQYLRYKQTKLCSTWLLLDFYMFSILLLPTYVYYLMIIVFACCLV